MSRNVKLGNNLDADSLGVLLQFDKLLLCIVAIARCKAREEIALQAEAGWRFAPVVREIFMEGVVIEVQMEGVHLVVCHKIYILMQEIHRNEFSSAVEHKRTHCVVGPIDNVALGECCSVLFGNLQECACSPHCATRGVGCNLNLIVDIDRVTLIVQLFISLYAECNVAV